MRPTTEHVADLESNLQAAHAELASFRAAAAARREVEEKVTAPPALLLCQALPLAVHVLQVHDLFATIVLPLW